MGKDRRLNVVILECFICRWERGEVGRGERWKANEVARWERLDGSEVESWESQERVMRWQGGKSGRMVRWQGGRFLVLFKSWGCSRVSPRISSFCF